MGQFSQKIVCVVKMKKIYLILMLAILIVGIGSGLTINSIKESQFKTKITTISSDLFYSKLLTLNKIDSKDIPQNTTLNLEDSGLEITKNKEGVIRVRVG